MTAPTRLLLFFLLACAASPCSAGFWDGDTETKEEETASVNDNIPTANEVKIEIPVEYGVDVVRNRDCCMCSLTPVFAVVPHAARDSVRQLRLVAP